MIIQNVDIFTPDCHFCRGSIVVKDDRIERVILDGDPVAGSPADVQEAEQVMDGSGCYAIPGLIDIHFHGCMGADFCDGTRDAIRILAEYEARSGITAICPATLTLPVSQLCHVLSEGAAYARRQQEGLESGADLVGVNMEGPFISHVKKGAQNEDYIIPCDADICEQFIF